MSIQKLLYEFRKNFGFVVGRYRGEHRQYGVTLTACFSLHLSVYLGRWIVEFQAQFTHHSWMALTALLCGGSVVLSGLIPDSRNIFLWGAGLLGFVALMRIFSAVYEKPVDLGVVVTRKRSFFTLRGLETYIPTPWGTKTLYVPILSKWQPVLSGVVDDVLSDSMKQLWKAKGMVARIVLCSAWQTFCGIPFRRIHWYELQAACMCMCAQSVEVPISFWPGNPEVICREVKNVLDIYSESLVDFKDTYPDCKMTKATYNAESHESAH